LLNKSKAELIELSIKQGYSDKFLQSVDENGATMKDILTKEIESNWDEHMCWKMETMTSQARASQTHYCSRKRLRALKESGIPITVQISSEDKLVHPRQQWQLARYLAAETLVLKGAGHMGAREQWKKWSKGMLSHFKRSIKVDSSTK